MLRSAVTMLLVTAALFSSAAGAASSGDMDAEIDHLIGAVGKDGCMFVRNERKFSSRDARRYLRSKLRRNAQLISSSEDFIEKIASRSVTSGRPYLIDCRGSEPQRAGQWFSRLLADYRERD